MQYQQYYQSPQPALYHQTAPLFRQPNPAASDSALPSASSPTPKDALYTPTSYPLSHAPPQSSVAPSSPQSPWQDSPMTVYKMSPQTDLADGDLPGAYYDSDDEDLVVREDPARPHRPQSPQDKDLLGPIIPPFTGPLPSPSAYTLGDLNKEQQSDPAQMRLFTSQLQEDIKTASLFASSIPPATFSPLVQSAMPVAQQLSAPVQSSTPATSQPGVVNATDVTPRPPVHTQTATLARQPSMHLQLPAQPINPFQRPAARAPSPFQPFPAPSIPLWHLRKYHQQQVSQGTTSLAQLVLPNAQFHFSPDPAALAAEITSPPNWDLDDLVDEYDGNTDVEDWRSTAPLMTDRIMPTALPAVDVDFAAVPEQPMTMVTRSGALKRPRGLFTTEAEDAQSEDDDDYEGEEDAEADDGDDEEYKAPSKTRAAVAAAAAAASEPPAKRARVSNGSAVATRSTPLAPTITAVESSTLPTTPIEASRPRATKARTRHLQPGLVRTNGCLHGCELTFSTAYEARRHQEDFHGREEAYKLISQQRMQPDKAVLPCDYRFVIQIGLSHNVGVDKWDNKVKTEFTKAASPATENNPLPKHLVTALMDFAQEWTKRYECSMCGTSFSRLDSKKRHYAKQCTPAVKRA